MPYSTSAVSVMIHTLSEERNFVYNALIHATDCTGLELWKITGYAGVLYYHTGL